MPPFVPVWIAMAALALGYVVLPWAAAAYLEARAERSVVCPETGRTARVRLDAWLAAWTAPGRDAPRLDVVECSEWPARAGCARGCLAAAGSGR